MTGGTPLSAGTVVLVEVVDVEGVVVFAGGVVVEVVLVAGVVVDDVLADVDGGTVCGPAGFGVELVDVELDVEGVLVGDGEVGDGEGVVATLVVEGAESSESGPSDVVGVEGASDEGGDISPGTTVAPGSASTSWVNAIASGCMSGVGAGYTKLKTARLTTAAFTTTLPAVANGAVTVLAVIVSSPKV